MANTSTEADIIFRNDEQLRFVKFEIVGLFDGEKIEINFPTIPIGKSEASILILQGRNGSGKTTVLKMIEGMLRLDFDAFRRVPFVSAALTLSNNDVLAVRWEAESPFPLVVTFGDFSAELDRDRENPKYSTEHEKKIELFRAESLPVLGSINFEFLGIDRSISSEKRRPLEDGVEHVVERNFKSRNVLSARVRKFILEAQFNNRQYFRSEELSILPNILDRLKRDAVTSTQSELFARIFTIKEKSSLMKRFGLQMEEDELGVLLSILSPKETLDPKQLYIVETYVEMQEAGQRSRDLIAHRLIEFEAIMDDFLLGKQVQVDSRNGLRIVSKTGRIPESSLSSGEYHFLYMMVAALLCQRAGSIIAIDEPELSLHVRWQRKLLGALTRCAAGASPLFICATHSLAISAEHADRVQILSAVD